MKQRDLLIHFMRSLKAKGLLPKDINSSLVDSFRYSELPRLKPIDSSLEHSIETALDGHKRGVLDLNEARNAIIINIQEIIIDKNSR